MSGTLHSAPGCKSRDTDDGGAAATYLVSIAGSAGGFAPLQQLLAELPLQFNAAIVAILHSGPRSLLANTLRNRIRLPVWPAVSGALLKPGHVYVAPPGTHVIVNPDARMTVSDAPRLGRFRPSADWLFESAAASFGARHIGVVLSGMLWDGAAKLGAVKRSGGIVFVQAPDDAMYAGMPNAAIATGFVDQVIPIHLMAGALADALSRRDVRLDTAAWETPFDEPIA